MKRKLSIALCAGALLLIGCGKDEMPKYGRPWDRSIAETKADVVSEDGLPVVFITLDDGKEKIKKDKWRGAVMTIVSSDDVEEIPIEIRGRGNSTWRMPKKPFNIRFTEETPLLGMAAAPRWCFLANYRDMTLIRNAVALEMSRYSCLDWTPEGRFVEVVLNGIHYGNYYVTEKVDLDHVQVGEDGYLLCMDRYYDEDYRFKTDRKEIPVEILTPYFCGMPQDRYDAIVDYMDDFEKALYKGKGNWEDYVDLDSFCDWFLLHELATNSEPGEPHSAYFHRVGDGPLQAGPVWDFDCWTFRTGIGDMWVNQHALWFDALLKETAFQETLRKRWAVLRPAMVEEIPAYIDETAASIRSSALVNEEMWGTERERKVNGDEGMSFDAAVPRLKVALQQRVEALDAKLL